MRRIIAVFHDNDLSSGATKSYLTNIEYLASQNNEFEVIAVVPKKEGKLSDYLNKCNIKVLSYRFGGCVYKDDTSFISNMIGFIRCFVKQSISFISSVKLFLYLRRHSFMPDAVYTNTSTINLGYWISKLTHSAHFWHIREFCLEDQGTRRLSDRYFSHQLSQSVQNICISKVIQEYYKNKYNMKNSVVLYNDFSVSYCIDDQTKEIHNGYNFIVTGSLCEKKGQLFAIKAFDKFQKSCHNCQCHLYIAGRMNSYGEYLKKYVNQNSIENVTFCGLVEDMNELRRKMDFSIIASEQEAFGRTVIEDMLAGIIVFGTNHGAIPEIIDNGRTGILYNHRDIDDLCKKLIETISSQETTFCIRKEARLFAEDFCKNSTAQNIYELFQRELDA